jgi:carbamoyl-phosphate synthase large subunit
MNIQFAIKDEAVYLIEVNPRASRTVPFVAKAIGRPIAKIAARVMAGDPLSSFNRFDATSANRIKESVFLRRAFGTIRVVRK